jgi:hypothetical protein
VRALVWCVSACVMLVVGVYDASQHQMCNIVDFEIWNYIVQP